MWTKTMPEIGSTSLKPNSDVLQKMHESDIFVYASVISGLSKGCIEAALTGLPVILKGGNDQLSSEFAGDRFFIVDGSKESYKSSITRLIEDDTFREQLGRQAYAYAREHWAPENIEAKYVAIYNQLLAN
jgi:L-malate glycosyltransferase